jgi:heme/copper-type cytochrome/quinol oxidase subunit 2
MYIAFGYPNAINLARIHGGKAPLEKLGLVMVVATFALAGGVLYFTYAHPFAQATAGPVNTTECTSFSNTFTIVGSQSGFNDSFDHRTPGQHWPVMCTHAGEEITIKIINVDSVEPHGFAVTHYLDAGVTILPGKNYTITLFAGTPGDFRVYCNVICAVHEFMQNGLLVVD